MAGKGGAWKVAYADFVTAMMALFMVLWICSQDKEVLIATSQYFQNPFNSPMKSSSGVMPLDSQKSSSDGSGKGEKEDSTSTVNLQFLNSIAKDFFRMMQLDEDLADKPIDIQVTSDGLRVNLFDRARQPLFQKNTAEFTEWGRFCMQSLAWMIDRNRFHVVIEGHTKPGLDLPKPDYTPWELSADRANASRRALTHYAVDDKQIDRVTGFASTMPLPDQPASSESNQRVTLSLTVGRPKARNTEETDSSAAGVAKPSAAAKTKTGSTPAPGIAGGH
ncbi:MAG: flagellar motor protein MotB [Nibricoccus sp.]